MRSTLSGCGPSQSVWCHITQVTAERLVAIAELQAEVRELKRARHTADSPRPGGTPGAASDSGWPSDGGAGEGGSEDDCDDPDEDSEEAQVHR